MAEISERDWLTAGFFWMGAAFLASMPPISHSMIGGLARVAINLVVLVHIGEAFYAMSLARRAGLDPNHWFWKTLLLGYFSWRKLADLPSVSKTS